MRPAWTEEGERFAFKRRLLAAIGVAQMVVARSAVYFGVSVGPEAHISFWDYVVAKHARCCALLRASPASFRQRLATYSTHVASVIVYRAA